MSFRLGQGLAFTGFVYLVFVVLAAMYGGFRQATIVSIAAAACLDYFFIPPIFSFQNSPANWAALGAFEFTALVISQLSHRARLQAAHVECLYSEMERLYQTSRRLLLFDGAAEPGDLIVSSIRDIFGLTGVQLFDAVPATSFRSGICGADAERRTREAYLLGADSFDPATRTWYCALTIGVRSTGGLALAGTDMSGAAAAALASLSAGALERARANQKESDAQADRRTEQLRASVLDALAHQFKTPLAIARAASSSLLALGGMTPLQARFVTAVDHQVIALDELASRLLAASALERDDFTVRVSPQRFSQLAVNAVEVLEPPAERVRIRLAVPSDETFILADRELVITSITQLLDNAVKYSEPGSPIDIDLAFRNREAVLTVRSKGLVITRGDHQRIFERFYRASETRHLASGTGLGLAIVKRIAESHHGHVWAEGLTGYGTAISISLPANS